MTLPCGNRCQTRYVHSSNDWRAPLRAKQLERGSTSPRSRCTNRKRTRAPYRRCAKVKRRVASVVRTRSCLFVHLVDNLYSHSVDPLNRAILAQVIPDSSYGRDQHLATVAARSVEQALFLRGVAFAQITAFDEQMQHLTAFRGELRGVAGSYQSGTSISIAVTSVEPSCPRNARARSRSFSASSLINQIMLSSPSSATPRPGFAWGLFSRWNLTSGI